MKMKFKKYDDSDFADLVQCMEGLQDYLGTTDSLKRTRRLAGFGKRYANNLLRKINRHNGLIILAYDKRKIVGCVAGIIEKQTRDNLLECVPTKAGRILELFVEDNSRNRGVGKELMKGMEDYFKRHECDIVRVAVFEPNKAAHTFYLTLDYQDRTVDMIKLLE